MATNVQRGTYSASSLADALLTLQQHFRVSSPDFYRAYRTSGAGIEHVPGMTQAQWASYYAEWLELTGAPDDAAPEEDALAGHTRREVACVA
jgi:hypothetical protein